MANLVQTEKRQLRCDLTASEIHEMSLQLAQENKKQNSLDDEKKSVASQFKAKLDECQARINKLSSLVTDGFEFRDIECEITYHQPEKGKKTVVRKDLDKIVGVERMQEFEWNLFNQPEDDVETETLHDEERAKLGEQDPQAQLFVDEAVIESKQELSDWTKSEQEKLRTES